MIKKTDVITYCHTEPWRWVVIDGFFYHDVDGDRSGGFNHIGQNLIFKKQKGNTLKVYRESVRANEKPLFRNSK